MTKEQKEYLDSQIERLLNAFQVLMYQGSITNDTKTFLQGVVLNINSVVKMKDEEK